MPRFIFEAGHLKTILTNSELRIHRVEEFTIALGLLELVIEKLDRIRGTHWCQNTAQYEDLL
jgi:hypothetical protein